MNNSDELLKKNVNKKNDFIIGFLTYSEWADNWINSIWNGIVDASKKHNVNLINFASKQLWYSPEHLADNLAVYEQINNKVDGLISTDLATPWVMEKLKAFLTKPSVLLNFSSNDITSITVDYAGGMKKAAEHLIRDHGFRRIAYIRGPVMSDTELRYQAYLEALKENGIPADPALISRPCITQGFGDGETAVNYFLNVAKVNFDAILANNDDIAIGAIHALESHKIKVPYDVAVIGFDDKIEAKSTTPPLTSVHAPIYEMGYRAVEIILEKLNGKKITGNEFIPTHLVLRRSCGCMTKSVNLASSKKINFLQNLKNKLLYKGRYFFSLKTIAGRCKKNITENLPEMESNLSSTWFNVLFDSFNSELKHPEQKKLIPALDLILNQMDKKNIDFSLMQDAVSILRNNSIPALFSNRNLLYNAENLYNKVRTFIAEAAVQQQLRCNIREEKRHTDLNAAGEKIINTFELSDLIALIERELQNFDISEGYLVLFENDVMPPEWSIQYLGFNVKEGMRYEGNKIRFLTKDLIPLNLKDKNQNFNYVVWPLNFQTEHIGYIVYKYGPRHRGTYLSLSNQIVSAIKGALLVKQINEHSRQLTVGIEDLTVTLDEMVRNIDSIVNIMDTQAKAVEQDALSIEDIVKNIDKTASMAGDLKMLSDQLNVIAIQGSESVNESIAAVNDVAKNSQQILDLLDMIKTIADQTNILAINAAIEAANAGDNGKGFSIVAEEIRLLADGIKENTVNIENVVRSTVTKINNSAELAKNTEFGLNAILAFSKQDREFSADLSQAITQQDKNAQEILKATKELVRITEEVKNAMTEQKKATDMFNDSLRKLKSIT